MKVIKKKKFFEGLKYTLSNIKYWIAYRTYDKYHIVKLGTKPGYQDVTHRLPIAVFELLRVFVEEEDGLGFYLEYKSGFRFSGKFDEQYEEYCKQIGPVYDALHKAYEWWKANKADFTDNEFAGKHEDEKQKEMTEHLINVVKYCQHLWT